ncbi:hypothetical protein OAQ99_01685 [Candidatus Kapabacteria bacterium]|nr:hypothetical protein [Candidatus Kapabacteria bacterium]
MEITPLKYEQTGYRREETLAQEAITPQKVVEQEAIDEPIKGSSSLQKEVLAILNAADEKSLQEAAKKQIEAGYLDIKV